jgi:RNA polymerase sigma-70 factor (ECF subfamily)
MDVSALDSRDQTAEAAEEADLVRRAQGGDAACFSRLVRLHERQAVAVAYRLLNHTEDARDVAQDAFIRAFRSLGQLEDPRRFRPWLLRTVSNLALNYRRARRSTRTAALDESLEAAGGLLDPRTGRRRVDADAGGDGPLPEELQSLVTEAIGALPEKQRMSLILFSVEGLPQKEVADILDCSVELVKWNVFQARKKLKEVLAAYL